MAAFQVKSLSLENEEVLWSESFRDRIILFDILKKVCFVAHSIIFKKSLVLAEVEAAAQTVCLTGRHSLTTFFPARSSFQNYIFHVKLLFHNQPKVRNCASLNVCVWTMLGHIIKSSAVQFKIPAIFLISKMCYCQNIRSINALKEKKIELFLWCLE